MDRFLGAWALNRIKMLAAAILVQVATDAYLLTASDLDVRATVGKYLALVALGVAGILKARRRRS
jgi:hypothetical protein